VRDNVIDDGRDESVIDVRENDGVCDDNCGLWIEMKAVGK
jgi:hypothetical protein